MNQKLVLLFAMLFLVLSLIISGIDPFDRGTWFMEVLPVLIVVPLLIHTYKRFPLTNLLYVLIGFTVIGLGGALQTHLMDIAGDAQTLAASLNHSAFNLANALGAFLGGWVLSQNMGWLAPIWVGFVLSLGGLIILLIALAYAKYSANKQSVILQ